MIAFITTSAPVRNPKAWLIALTCNASRKYWRNRIHRELDRERAHETIAEADLVRLERELVVAKVLSRLRPSEREILRMHYFQRLSASEIAGRLNTTLRYAEKLIHKALRRARDVYADLQEWSRDRRLENVEQLALDPSD